MTSDKIDQMAKERKAAEEKQRAEKEEREAKINRQEKLVKFLVFGGFLFVVLYNLAKTAQSLAKKEVNVVLTPESLLGKCEKELLAQNSCRKEVEDLCSALGIKVGIIYNRHMAPPSYNWIHYGPYMCYNFEKPWGAYVAYQGFSKLTE